jgi:mannose-1-phosphate guanylyltransferase/mannose-6-phosphate isomerase
MKIIPVILAGGSGTRLWPLSRGQHPKQYLPLISENTMLQETILRIKDIDGFSAPIIICNNEHRFLVAEQCQQIGVNEPIIILEPIGRNTAPAIAVAACHAKSIGDAESLLLVLSADHDITDISEFHSAIDKAVKAALRGGMVTFGTVPDRPHTGYGYIKKAKDGDGVSKVEKFVEKPNIEKATEYFKTGDYLWNSGMFMFEVDSFINELSIYDKETVKVAKKSIDNSVMDLDFIRLDELTFSLAEDQSIDFALMEKSKKVVVVPLDAGWSDVGSWDSMHEVGEKDIDNNVIKGDVITHGTSNSYISANGSLVATLGVDNLVIVNTPDVTLVADKSKSQEIKILTEALSRANRTERLENRKVYRPWGWYDSIESGNCYKVKRLFVNPGAKLSLQMHNKRAEHWVVVRGTATVTNGDNILTLREGESTYIPITVRHSLENKEATPLEVIEVQSGMYLGEDDIVRFEDIYGRS